MKERLIKDLIYKQYKDLSDNEVLDMWYDWFCKESSLVNKGRILLQRLDSIAGSTKFNPNTSYIFFKNNMPVDGYCYDDFRIVDQETGKVLYTVVPRSGFTSKMGVAEVWGKENGFTEPLASGKWKDIKRFFLNNNNTPEQDVSLSNR